MAQPRIGQTVVVDVPATTANIGPGFDCLGAALDLNNRFTMRRIEGDGERFELIIEGQEGSISVAAPRTWCTAPHSASGKQLERSLLRSKPGCGWQFRPPVASGAVPQPSLPGWWEPMPWSENR